MVRQQLYFIIGRFVSNLFEKKVKYNTYKESNEIDKKKLRKRNNESNTFLKDSSKNTKIKKRMKNKNKNIMKYLNPTQSKQLILSKR